MRTKLTADDPTCPERLRSFLEGEKPMTLTVSRPLSLPAPVGARGPARCVAIIGARKADDDALKCARALAATVVSAGGVVVSGGAFGIDNAAHEGALDAGGITWCVAPSAPNRETPKEHKPLFARIEASGGGMLWTLPMSAPTTLPHFHVRNAVLVSLADLVIVVQAELGSGSLQAASKALALGRLRVVRPATWSVGYKGSRALLRRQPALALESMDEVRALLGLPPLVVEGEQPGDGGQQQEATAQLSLDLSPDQANLFQRVTQSPQHVDEIAHSAGLRPGQAATLLLTLALENVVVEGPSGFFRRQQLL